MPPNDGCGGRIEITYDLESIKDKMTRSSLKRKSGGLWKYVELMPIRDKRSIITLGEGNTSLLKSERVSFKLGLRNLFLKLETTNPSGSFKDRPICVGVTRAREDRARTVVAASSGNAAASMATYAAKGGLEAVVFVPETAPAAKLVHLRTLGAQVFRVRKAEEGVDATTTLLRMACAQLGWTPVPSFGPFNCFQFEGTKSLGFEIAEQMAWEPPDWILFPTGSGGLMAGTMKGLWEFQRIGLIDRLPKPVVVQPEGCAPIVRAFNEKSDPLHIEPWGSNETIAGGLADPYPWDGDAALKYLKLAHGTAVQVSDHAIEEHLLMLANLEGIFAEPSGVAALAGIEPLLETGMMDPSDTVVVPITGSGFKDLGAADRLTPQPAVVGPDIQELRAALRKEH